MKIVAITSGKVDTNTYLLINEITLKTIVVDPSDGIEEIISYIDTNHLIVTHVLLTHGHFDHIAGVKALQDRGAIVYLHAKDMYMIQNPLPMAKLLNVKVENFKVNNIINMDSVLEINGYKIKVIQTPGHSEGGVCYVLDCALFSGDTLFKESYGRYDFEGGNFSKLRESVQKLLSLEEDLFVYPGHGPYTTLKYEKANNPLR